MSFEAKFSDAAPGDRKSKPSHYEMDSNSQNKNLFFEDADSQPTKGVSYVVWGSMVGGVALVLVIGMISFFMYKNKKQNERSHSHPSSHHS